MAKSQEQTRTNPNCFGFGSDNVLGCNCKKIFEETAQAKKDAEERRRQEYLNTPPHVRETLPPFDVYDVNAWLSQK